MVVSGEWVKFFTLQMKENWTVCRAYQGKNCRRGIFRLILQRQNRFITGGENRDQNHSNKSHNW
jgi:hypothetical protein